MGQAKRNGDYELRVMQAKEKQVLADIAEKERAKAKRRLEAIAQSEKEEADKNVYLSNNGSLDGYKPRDNRAAKFAALTLLAAATMASSMAHGQRQGFRKAQDRFQ
jgi:hypothetical protein